jgi:predicted peptidase
MIPRRRFILAFLTLLIARPMHAEEAITSPPKEQPDPYDVFEARVYTGAAGGALPYRLLKPLDYDSRQKYPLVLFLHGAGERGNKNDLQLVHGGRNFVDQSMRRRHPAFIVAPQCPDKKKWVEVPWEGKSHKMPAEPSEALRAVLELLPALQKEFSIDEDRVYGVGLSMGGFGIWDILQRKPELLGGAVIICGGGDPAYADRFKATPVWAFHGSDDPTVTVERSRDMVKALQAAGGRPIYTEYDGVEHNSWTQTFDNRLVWDWLFAQHK